jgi:hypothetical protein
MLDLCICNSADSVSWKSDGRSSLVWWLSCSHMVDSKLAFALLYAFEFYLRLCHRFLAIQDSLQWHRWYLNHLLSSCLFFKYLKHTLPSSLHLDLPPTSSITSSWSAESSHTLAILWAWTTCLVNLVSRLKGTLWIVLSLSSTSSAPSSLTSLFGLRCPSLDLAVTTLKKESSQKPSTISYVLLRFHVLCMC